MESQAVSNLLFEYQSHGKQSWATEFCAGIHAIKALGSCLIVVSHPKAALISLIVESPSGCVWQVGNPW
jgi:hypothetical protein